MCPLSSVSLSFHPYLNPTIWQLQVCWLLRLLLHNVLHLQLIGLLYYLEGCLMSREQICWESTPMTVTIFDALFILCSAYIFCVCFDMLAYLRMPCYKLLYFSIIVNIKTTKFIVGCCCHSVYFLDLIRKKKQTFNCSIFTFYKSCTCYFVEYVMWVWTCMYRST